MKKIQTVFIIIAAIIVGAASLTSSPAYAAQGSIFFNPSSGRKDPGSTFTVEVRSSVQNPNSPFIFVGGASVGVTYPNTLLQATGVSTAGSSMGGSATINQGAGTISYNAFISPPRYGTNLLLFTITFRAIGTGAATLNFSPTTNVNDGPTTKQAATLSIAPAPPASCPAGQVGTPPNCTTPTPNPTPVTPTPTPTPTAPKPTPTPTPIAPVTTPVLPDIVPEAAAIQTPEGELSIENVAVKTGWHTNTITWTASLPDTTSTVSIGTSKDKQKPTGDVTQQEDKSYLATLANLAPGTRYYYTIFSALTSDPEKKATYQGAFTTKGYPVSLTFNRDDRPVVGAKITIDKAIYTTDKKGAIALELANKAYTATITTNDDTKQTVTFTVAKKTIPQDGSDPPIQKFSFALTSAAAATASDTPSLLSIIGIIFGGLLLTGAILGFLLYRRKRTEGEALPEVMIDSYPQNSPLPAYSPPPSMPESSQYDATSLAAIEQEIIPEVNNVIPSNEQAYYPDGDMTETPALNDYPVAPEYEQLPEDIPSEAVLPNEPPLQPSQPLPEAIITQPINIAPSPAEQLSELPVSTENIVSEQPTNAVDDADPGAIYDPKTGDLAIIHHAKSGGGS